MKDTVLKYISLILFLNPFIAQSTQLAVSAHSLTHWQESGSPLAPQGQGGNLVQSDNGVTFYVRQVTKQLETYLNGGVEEVSDEYYLVGARPSTESRGQDELQFYSSTLNPKDVQHWEDIASHINGYVVLKDIFRLFIAETLIKIDFEDGTLPDEQNLERYAEGLLLVLRDLSIDERHGVAIRRKEGGWSFQKMPHLSTDREIFVARPVVEPIEFHANPAPLITPGDAAAQSGLITVDAHTGHVIETDSNRSSLPAKNFSPGGQLSLSAEAAQRIHHVVLKAFGKLHNQTHNSL